MFLKILASLPKKSEKKKVERTRPVENGNKGLGGESEGYLGHPSFGAENLGQVPERATRS